LTEPTQTPSGSLSWILDAVQEGILVIDPLGGVRLANAAARKSLLSLAESGDGRQIRRLGGRPLPEILARAQGVRPLELSTAGSNPRTFDLRAIPAGAGPGNLGLTLLRIRDVTEERNLSRRSSHQERLAAVGQLAAGIAHDFNNIMAAIVLYSDMLRGEPGLSAQAIERLDVACRQAQRAAALTQQILDFSRQGVLALHPLELGPFMAELQALLARMLPETIRVTIESDVGSLVIRADPTRMQQVFMNLAVNARDAMPEGGDLRIRLARAQFDPGAAMPFPGMRAGEWVRIRVSDTGTGIPADVLPRVFEPFFTTKPPGEGTGLGLAQVYGIVKQHGGFIDVASPVGHGTTFEIYLPSEAAAVGNAPAPREENRTAGQKETILVVEDDATTREALAAALRTLHYRLLIAANGREALATLEAEAGRIDLVLSDLVMPEMGGRALYETVRDTYPEIRMMIMTGYPRIRGTRELLEYGRVSWLQKPIGVKELAEAVRDALGTEKTRPTRGRSEASGLAGDRAG
jgi:signal transduction histidine kinase/ActR/RegA family two-component response regulator